MEVIPAIDLRGGRVVRLYQGDFNQETVYSTDPVVTALEWQRAGATRVHVVDLDGAREGRLVNGDAIKAIANSLNIPVQVGGGIRDVMTAKRLIHSSGVERVVFGTVAVNSPDTVRTACEELGSEVIIVGVDARDGKVAVQAWSETAAVNVEELIMSMMEMSVHRFIYTDISTDGALTGPNLQAVAALVEKVPAHIISSGGISNMKDLEHLEALGVEGVIVGRALYTSDVDMEEAARRFSGNTKGIIGNHQED